MQTALNGTSGARKGSRVNKDSRWHTMTFFERQEHLAAELITKHRSYKAVGTEFGICVGTIKNHERKAKQIFQQKFAERHKRVIETPTQPLLGEDTAAELDRYQSLFKELIKQAGEAGFLASPSSTFTLNGETFMLDVALHAVVTKSK